MPSWFYFDRPQNLAFHNLCDSKAPPPNLRSLLGLGLKFCPSPRYTTHVTSNMLSRFRRDLYLKTFYAGKSDDNQYNPRTHICGTWIPPWWNIPYHIRNRCTRFENAIKPLFPKKFGRNNLLPHHRRALRYLRKQKDFIVVKLDKNLGTGLMQTDQYIKRACQEHLYNRDTYTYLTAATADEKIKVLKSDIRTWLRKFKNDITPMEYRFIHTKLKENTDPYSYFYLMPKVHKSPWTTRPIISYSGSLLHPLGILVDKYLQSIAKDIPTYIQDSKSLKEELCELTLPPGAKLFTADATSMYTNIHTRAALNMIGQYFRHHRAQYSDIPLDAVHKGLELIMLNNFFKFGDSQWRQNKGTAMGTPPAPSYATIFFGIHEIEILQRFSRFLFFLKRYIDDILGIWIPSDPAVSDAQWILFKSKLQDWFGLEWTVTELTDRVDFMDMTISIKDNKLVTTLYEKNLNLYLYIPPHSAHPPGVLNGIIFGHIYRIFHLCSDKSDQKGHIQRFYVRLQRRGYKPSTLKAIFTHALSHYGNAHRPISRPVEPPYPNHPDIPWHQMYLHVPYHPNNLPSYMYQLAWRNTINAPKFEQRLQSTKNINGTRINIDRMVVAHSRPSNLGNKLSYRKLDVHIDPPN